LKGKIPRCVINGVRNKFWEQKKKQDLWFEDWDDIIIIIGVRKKNLGTKKRQRFWDEDEGI
jgi:hypothetical protein